MTKKWSNAGNVSQSNEFSVMRREYSLLQYSCTYMISDNFLIPIYEGWIFQFLDIFSKRIHKERTILQWVLSSRLHSETPTFYGPPPELSYAHRCTETLLGFFH